MSFWVLIQRAKSLTITIRGDNESAEILAFRLKNELKIEELRISLIICADIATGIKKAIKQRFPKQNTRMCVHQVNTLKYVSDKDKALATGTKTIYQAADEQKTQLPWV